MKILKELENLIRRIDFQNGYVCDVCGKEIFEYPVHRLCAECEEKLHRNDGRTCPKCGRKTLSDGVCLTCKRKLPNFSLGFSPFVYKDATAAFVNRAKNGNRALAYFFGENMAQCLQNKAVALSAFRADEENNNEIKSQDKMLIIPIPMTESSLIERGYNQAEKMARVVFEVLSEQGYAVELDTEVLLKRKETRAQKQLTYVEREENVAGAFHVHKRKACKDRVIVLVDDIMTTGATGSECAARLYGAGAKEVLFLTAASVSESK